MSKRFVITFHNPVEYIRDNEVLSEVTELGLEQMSSSNMSMAEALRGIGEPKPMPSPPRTTLKLEASDGVTLAQVQTFVWMSLDLSKGSAIITQLDADDDQLPNAYAWPAEDTPEARESPEWLTLFP
ncbi:hypothetical protein [Skermanella pratensis]|uniref:hypothetical protein n=1 Tax=Skermanella pratensis TaxID=2233999 RepID=UPI001300F361|nr:hypothetical protein [Skermanella pratensis]